MALPSNNAKETATKDEGLVSKKEHDALTAELELSKEIAAKVLACKTPADYKAVIDTYMGITALEDALNNDASRTTILLSNRVSPKDYNTFKKVLIIRDMEPREGMSMMINDAYEKCKVDSLSKSYEKK